jgi:hypothetical protein
VSIARLTCGQRAVACYCLPDSAQNALPTNGMRACTAVLVELSYAEVEGYVGEVEFLSR